jgi:hypothetical protein
MFYKQWLSGTGDLKHITELFETYVKDCQDNGKQQQEFRVIKVEGEQYFKS